MSYTAADITELNDVQHTRLRPAVKLGQEVRRAEDGDEVIAALKITGAETEAILSVSEKGWKVTPGSDIPVKGGGV